MPDLIVGSAEDALVKLGGQWGVSWPNPWWPTGNPAYNDCAACMSWCLFGLNGTQPFYTYVSEIQNWGRSLGVWHSGAAGMQPGDVIAYDWGGDGDPDHTEMCVSVSGSSIVSRGTNSSGGDDLIDRTRSASQVLSYVRPPYSTASQTGDSEMSNIIHHPNGSLALAGSDGSFTILQDMDEVNSLIAAGSVPADQSKWVWAPDPLMWNKLAEVASLRTASNNPPEEEETQKVGGVSWTIWVGLILIVIALVLPIIDTFLPHQAVSQDALDTAVKVTFGAAAVLLGIGAGGQLHPLTRLVRKASSSASSDSSSDNPGPVLTRPGRTPTDV